LQVALKDKVEDSEILPIKLISDDKKSQISGSAVTQSTGKHSPAAPTLKPCGYYENRYDFKKEVCPAKDKTYHRCGNLGHFSRICHSSKVHIVDDEVSNDEELFLCERCFNSQALVTCAVNQKHEVVFEINTGASCNVLPFSDYVMATGDTLGWQIYLFYFILKTS